jgi:hypothetical protein
MSHQHAFDALESLISIAIGLGILWLATRKDD